MGKLRQRLHLLHDVLMLGVCRVNGRLPNTNTVHTLSAAHMTHNTLPDPKLTQGFRVLVTLLLLLHRVTHTYKEPLIWSQTAAFALHLHLSHLLRSLHSWVEEMETAGPCRRLA